MHLLVNALGLLVSVLVSVFSSAVETGLYRVSRVRMRVRRDKGEARAELVLRNLDRLDDMVTTILITNNIAAYAATYFLTMQLIRWGMPQAELTATVILSPTFFIFCESLPKQIAYSHADDLTLLFARTVDLCRKFFTPAVWLLNKASAAIRNLIGAKGNVDLAPSERAKLMEYFEAGVADKILTEDQNRMAKRIIDLEGINAADIMIPNARLYLLPERTSRARAVARMAESGADLVMLTDGAGRPTGKILTLNILIRNPGRPEESVANLAVTLGRIKSGAFLTEVLLWLKREHAQRVAVTSRGRVIGVITTKSILDKIAGM